MSNHIDHSDFDEALDVFHTVNEYLTANIVLANKIFDKLEHFEQMCQSASDILEQTQQVVNGMFETLESGASE